MRGVFLKADKLFYYMTLLATVLFAVGMLIFQNSVGNSARDALSLCAFSVIPSLFPFLVLSKLTTNLRLFEKLEPISRKIMRPLFSLGYNCAPALILGITGGYPVGAITTASLYRDGCCTKEEAERLLSFSNNCGPAFIIAVIGYEIFGSSLIGSILYIIHILSAFLCGFVFRIIIPFKTTPKAYGTQSKKQTPGFSFAFTDAVYNALRSSLLISAYIVLFSAILVILQKAKILPMISALSSFVFHCDSKTAEAFLSGLFEVTKGAHMLSDAASAKVCFVLISTILGWGGLSVHAQTLGCISDSGLSTKPYFIGKLLHGFFSFLLSSASLLIFKPPTVEVFSTTADTFNFKSAPILAFISVVLIFIFCKKGWKKAK